MSVGVFTANQPVYAEHGIATFPLNDQKKPTVSNYQKMGLPASSRLADRFRNANGFGFMTNASSRVTVLDVDTTDEHVLADAMGRHGSTPVIVRTASGKHHALYRHSGEFRKIRPFAETHRVDPRTRASPDFKGQILARGFYISRHAGRLPRGSEAKLSSVYRSPRMTRARWERWHRIL